MFGFQAAAAQVRTTSHSCVQMFFPSGSRCVSCLLVTKVQRVLLVAVSDLSLLATDRSCADWKGLGASELRAAAVHVVGVGLLRGRAPCWAGDRPLGCPWFYRLVCKSTPFLRCTVLKASESLYDGHEEFLLWVVPQLLIQMAAQAGPQRHPRVSNQNLRWAFLPGTLPHSSSRGVFSVWITGACVSLLGWAESSGLVRTY